MAGQAWSDAENDAVVADYFAMLARHQAGESYSKAAHNRALQGRIDRSRSSIEFKHQNISAVLRFLGDTWLPGYRPLSNFQESLGSAVLRWKELHPEQVAESSLPEPGGILVIGVPPTLSNRGPDREDKKRQQIISSTDHAASEARNRALGRAGERCVLAHERETLERAGRSDLADRVAWVSEEQGDGAGYDIASFEADGRDRLIEVKTTRSTWERMPFFITANELSVSRDLSGSWCLIRLWNFAFEPRAFELRPPLDRHVRLFATVYRAGFSGAV